MESGNSEGLRHRKPPSSAAGRGWRFPGWGEAATVVAVRTKAGELAGTDEIAAGAIEPHAPKETGPRHASLGQFTATSIAGNDLLSSCLYTAGACAQYAGKLAPFSLMLVSFMLYFFRFVYSEVVTAMPVNGGSYNALLNTTSKRFAAMAACLSLISYVATAVVSGCYAILYLQRVWGSLDVHIGTIFVLGIFAVLTLIGVGESAAVATGMFFMHVFALLLLCGWCVAAMFRDNFNTFAENWQTGYPAITTTSGWLVAEGSAPAALFFGYAAALLGITGFETAANYVEEMRDSTVYVATLRNMWWAAALFNPVISLLVMGVMPMTTAVNGILNEENSKVLLCVAAEAAAGITHPGTNVGSRFAGFIAVDACIVLAGSVLTAYVGVTGLVRRLALDRCLPEVLMTLNKLRGTPHWIIIGFFILTSSLFLMLYPPSSHNVSAVDNLGNVYDLAFLSVMSAFAVSALILKWKRPDLPRRIICSYPVVIIALLLVLTGLVGNIIEGPETLPYFILYVGAIAAVVFAMFQRSTILTFLYVILRGVLASKAERARLSDRETKLITAHVRTEGRRLAAQHAAGDGDDASASKRKSRRVADGSASDSEGGLLSPSAGSATTASPDMGAGATPSSPRKGAQSAAQGAASHVHMPDGVPGEGDVVGLPATVDGLLALATGPMTGVATGVATSVAPGGLRASTLRTAAGGDGYYELPAAGGSSGGGAPLPGEPVAGFSGVGVTGAPGGGIVRWVSGMIPTLSRRSSSAEGGAGIGSGKGFNGGKRNSSVGVALGPMSGGFNAMGVSRPLPTADLDRAPSAAAASPFAAGAYSDAAALASGGPIQFTPSSGAHGGPSGYSSHTAAGASANGGGAAAAERSRGESSGSAADEDDFDEDWEAEEEDSRRGPAAGGDDSTAALSAALLGAQHNPGGRAQALLAEARSAIGSLASPPHMHRPAASYFTSSAASDASCSAVTQLAVSAQAGLPVGSFRNALGDVRLSKEAERAAAKEAARRARPWRARLYTWLTRQIRAINSQQIVFFAKKADLVSLNKAVLYVRDNELTARLVVVHVVDDREDLARILADTRAAMQGTLEASNGAPLPPAAALHAAREAAAGAGSGGDGFAARVAGAADAFASGVAPGGGSSAGALRLLHLHSRGAAGASATGAGSDTVVPFGGDEETAAASASAAASGASLALASMRSGGVGSIAAALQLLDRLPPPPAEALQLQHNCALLDAVYPKLRIDCLVVRGSYFSPGVVTFLSRYLGVTPNLMFMAMPDADFQHQFAALGGVRVITRTGKKAERESAARHLQHVLREIRRHQTAVDALAAELGGGATAGVAGARGAGDRPAGPFDAAAVILEP